MLVGIRDNVEELKQRVLKLESMLSIAQQEKANLEDDFRHVLEQMQLVRKTTAYGYNQKI
jgi:hypothetical protein